MFTFSSLFLSSFSYSSIIVGLSLGNKRKQPDFVKADKRVAKRSWKDLPLGESSVSKDVCTNCHQPEHKSARSPKCPNYSASKKDVFKGKLDQGLHAFTRELPSDKCTNEPCENSFKSAAVSVSKDVREIVFRAKLFVNYYVPPRSERQNGDIPHCIFKQQFWCSICQLVNAKRITNNNNIPNDLLGVWDSFWAE